MASRRQIREAVVQFLYSAENIDNTSSHDSAWLLLTEVDRRKYAIARVKALTHFSSGRADRIAELVERATLADAHLSAADTSALRLSLKRIKELESISSATLDSISKTKIPAEDEGETLALLEKNFTQLFLTEKDLLTHRKQFLLGIDDVPAIKGHLEAIAATLRRCQKATERILLTETPTAHPEQSDLKHLAALASEIDDTLRDAQSLAHSVIQKLPVIDERIAAVVENFAPERIAPVDRAILRLAIYELLEKAEINTGIIINEALELAKKYSTEQSASFVNGVLDRVATARK